MANTSGDPFLDLIAKERSEGKWERALRDIFYFIEHYVPKRLFDLRLASKQQIQLLKAVQEGHRYFVIRAPRKGGKTIIVAIVAVWLTMKNQAYRVFVLAGSEYQATWLYDYCKKIIWPSGIRNKEIRDFFAQFLIGEPKTTITEYKAGGWIMYSTATSKSVNAPTADCIIMDEFVLIPTNIVEEAWPMINSSDDPRRFLLSTATEGKDNTEAFLDILDEAKDLGFVAIEWERSDSPHLQKAVSVRDAAISKKILSEGMYITQIEGGLPQRAGRIFPRTFIREAFIAPDPDNPGFLLDGTPYDPENLEFKGEAKGGIDWGFDHDTVFLEGYRGLNHKIVSMKMVIGSGTSPSDWAQQAEDDSLAYEIQDWYADASGAFQNQEIKDRGFRVTSRAFQHMSRGKEWMIGIAHKWLSKKMVIIPDTEEFKPLKEQLLKWRRGADGKPKKGNDHCCDAFIVWLSGWDPRYYDEEVGKGAAQSTAEPISTLSANDWDQFASSPQQWMPEEWAEHKRELTKNPWEK